MRGTACAYPPSIGPHCRCCVLPPPPYLGSPCGRFIALIAIAIAVVARYRLLAILAEAGPKLALAPLMGRLASPLGYA